jgi:hypothetical protein
VVQYYKLARREKGDKTLGSTTNQVWQESVGYLRRMSRKGFPKTAVNDVALSQREDFTANGILGDVEAHPAMDGRKIHPIAISRYLGIMADDGYIMSWIEEGSKSKTYCVKGYRVNG